MSTPPQLCVFVQNNLVEKLTAPVAVYARNQGFTLIDRSSTSELDIDNCGIDWSPYSFVLCYGSVQFVRKLAQSTLARHLSYSDESFDAGTWAKQLGPQLLNESAFELSATDCTRHLKNHPEGWHIRPKFEGKAFNGSVYNQSTWENVLQAKNLAPELMCVMSPVKPILAEWRVWVVDRKVTLISQYRENNEMRCRLSEDPLVWQTARKIAEGWLPAKNVVIDLAATVDGLKIVEFNPIHSSGWYAADPAIILKALVDSLATLEQANNRSNLK